MNRIALLIFPILFFCFIVNDEPRAIKTTFNDFTTDALGNIYVINGDELIKFNVIGKQLSRYSNLKLGTITCVDATNPLKLLLYYRDFQQIIFLDNQLSVNSNVVPLQELGYEQTELVCASVNNSFWIYNKQNNDLLRFNENSKQIASTGNLKQILQSDLKPNYMLEHNNYLYLNCPETGIYVFDIFGTFNTLVPLKNLKHFQVKESIIYYQNDSSLCSYNYKLFENACKRVKPLSGKIRLEKNTMYFAFKDSLVVEHP
jgi:hypothetical protein